MNIDKLDSRELYDLKEALDKLLVFGLWRKIRETLFVRPEPSRRADDSRAAVWWSTGKCDLKPGWYFRIGFGVVGIGGVSGTVAFESAEDCMKQADKLLRQAPDLYLVETAEEETNGTE